MVDWLATANGVLFGQKVVSKLFGLNLLINANFATSEGLSSIQIFAENGEGAHVKSFSEYWGSKVIVWLPTDKVLVEKFSVVATILPSTFQT